MSSKNNKEKDSANLRDRATMIVTLVAAIILVAGFAWLNMNGNKNTEVEATTVYDIHKAEESTETSTEKAKGNKLDDVATLAAYDTPTKAKATDSKKDDDITEKATEAVNETAESDTAESDTAESDTAESDTAESDTAESDTVEDVNSTAVKETPAASENKETTQSTKESTTETPKSNTSSDSGLNYGESTAPVGATAPSGATLGRGNINRVATSGSEGGSGKGNNATYH